MSWYFMVDTYVDEDKGRGEYDEYIRQVKPIVEAHGGIMKIESVPQSGYKAILTFLNG